MLLAREVLDGEFPHCGAPRRSGSGPAAWRRRCTRRTGLIILNSVFNPSHLAPVSLPRARWGLGCSSRAGCRSIAAGNYNCTSWAPIRRRTRAFSGRATARPDLLLQPAARWCSVPSTRGARLCEGSITFPPPGSTPSRRAAPGHPARCERPGRRSGLEQDAVRSSSTRSSALDRGRYPREQRFRPRNERPRSGNARAQRRGNCTRCGG